MMNLLLKKNYYNKHYLYFSKEKIQLVQKLFNS